MTLSLILGLLLSAQTPQDCARIEAASERLACFDSFFPGERAPVDEESRFGLNKGEQLRRVDPEPAPSSIQDSVKSVVKLRDNRRRVELVNGQVWILSAETTRDRIRPGDAISIQAGSFGGYLLKTPNGILVRARRAE
jgi:hypothetical protein